MSFCGGLYRPAAPLWDEIRVPVLKLAVEHTARKRGSLADVADWKEIVQDIREEAALRQIWDNYVRDNAYAAGLSFDEVVDTVEAVGKLLNNEG